MKSIWASARNEVTLDLIVRKTTVGYPLHLTPIFCGLGSRDFGVPIGNDRAIRGWVNGHSLLHQPVEELAAAA